MGRRKKESEGEKENSGDGSGGCAGGRMEMDGVAVCIRKESAYGEALKELHIEVAASATTEIVLKPRKRKERLDSGGSLNQETKVIRSSSEERPEVKEDVSVRRVWSHDELKALADSGEGVITVDVAQEADASVALRELNPGPPAEELEARRSSERFSRGRCAAPRRRKVSRRAPAPSPDRSSSPNLPKLDVSSLHQQIEGDEPLTSRKILSPDDEPESPAVEALISPRNSLVMRLEYLDPNLPPSPPQTHLATLRQQDKQERRLTKQINSIKRQLKRYDEGFRVEFGYKPSQADKMANKDIKRLCTEMTRLKTQLSQLKDDIPDLPTLLTASIPNDFSAAASEDPRSESPTPGPPIKSATKSNKSMEEALQDVQKRLEEKRTAGGRSSDILELSSEQLLEEKLAVQKALLTLENTFGRPVDTRDRDLVRPLYQRYRALKRLVIRSSAGKLNNSASELATILEHEAMEFSTSVSLEQSEGTCEEPVTSEPALEECAECAPDSVEDVAAVSSSSSDSLAENLHALPLSQLLEQQKRVKEEKKQLRRSLREFEEKFQSETGRRAQKQDRLVIETIYLGYKQAKAKLRLLEALIAKKSQVKRNSC